jgi:hypothetical protein
MHGTGPMQTLDELFGDRSVVASFDLPGQLQAVVERLPEEMGLDAPTLVMSHTLFPYYTAFQPPSVQGDACGPC